MYERFRVHAAVGSMPRRRLLEGIIFIGDPPELGVQRLSRVVRDIALALRWLSYWASNWAHRLERVEQELQEAEAVEDAEAEADALVAEADKMMDEGDKEQCFFS